MCDTPKLALKVWPEFGRAVGLGRRKSYEVAREIGRYVDGRLIVPVKAVEEWLAQAPRASERQERDSA